MSFIFSILYIPSQEIKFTKASLFIYTPSIFAEQFYLFITIRNLARRKLVNNTWNIMCIMRKLQVKCIDHVMIKIHLEHLVTTGKIDGQQEEVGKERDSVAAWIGKDTAEQLDDTVRNVES